MYAFMFFLWSSEDSPLNSSVVASYVCMYRYAIIFGKLNLFLVK